MSKTEVWYLIGTLAVGGTERTLVDLVNNLNRTRFEPTVWTITEPGPLASELSDVPVRSLGATGKHDARAPVRFFRALRSERPDVLQSFLFFDNTLARLASLFAQDVTVVTGVREVPDDPSLVRSAVRRVTLPLSDRVVSNSAAGATFVIERGADERDVSVVRNGRDLSVYESATASEDVRAGIGVPEDAPLVGTVGRLVERKGHHDLLDAWPTVLDHHPDAHLVIVGDGPEREALERHIRRISSKNTVHLTGTRDDVPELLDAFDVFAFPSHYEGLPGALLEAMAAGLPIVTTPVDGNAELVHDGRSGRHVPVRDPNALAEELIDLLSNPDDAEALRTRAKQRANANFSLDTMVSEFEALYDALD
ncbi:glycosyltransferase [Halorussus gelatinilyticus]|uniref:Glycosyltransferase n=1 Tax=Halorussus gelatinilyticus TaxID=2937524 RepID=A0A8U0ILR8_9EURY|nr:glycosyltransferase [Halorussus gelatinilyticus]UPW01292.1 glycosyltransferase [Halorussus gelatinilyticus]